MVLLYCILFNSPAVFALDVKDAFMMPHNKVITQNESFLVCATVVHASCGEEINRTYNYSYEAARTTTNYQVSITSTKYNPRVLNITVGDSVTWSNDDSSSHKVDFISLGINSGEIQSGRTYTRAFTQAGVFTYSDYTGGVSDGTLNVTSNLGMQRGNLTLYSELFNLSMNGVATYYCANITANYSGNVELKVECFDSERGALISDKETISGIVVGNITLTFRAGSDGLVYTKHPTENLTLKPTLTLNSSSFNDDPSKIYSSLRNFITGLLEDYTANFNVSVEKDRDGLWYQNLTIPNSTPLGIMSYYVVNNYRVGGKLFVYKAYPVNLTIYINKSTVENQSYFLGQKVPIEFNYTNYYGDIVSLKSYIEGNGTILNFTELNLNTKGANYTLPMNVSGLHKVITTVNHSSGYIRNFTRSFLVPSYELKVDTLGDVFYPGDKVTIEIGILDPETLQTIKASSTSVSVIDAQSHTATLSVQETSTNKYTATYEVLKTAPLGSYKIQATAIDVYGNSYSKSITFTVATYFSNEYFNVSKPEKMTFTNLNAQSADVVLMNLYNADISNFTFNVTNYSEYITIDTAGMKLPLHPGNKTAFSYKITPTSALKDGDYTGYINITALGRTIRLPILFTIKFIPALKTEPSIVKVMLIKGKEKTVELTLKNDGPSLITNLQAIDSGDVATYVDVSAPNQIDAGKSDKILLTFKATQIGTFTGMLRISGSGNISTSASLELQTHEDYLPRMSNMSSTLIDLESKITALGETGADVASLTEDLESARQLKSNLENAYNSGDLEKAKDLLEQLGSKIAALDTAYFNAYQASQRQVVKCNDAICNAPLECNKCNECKADPLCRQETGGEDKSNKLFTIIVIFIIIAIVGVVIFSSLVPVEEEAGTAPPHLIPAESEEK